MSWGSSWFYFDDLQSRELPFSELPEGYTRCGWQDGAEKIWEQIVTESYGENDEEERMNHKRFVQRYSSQPNFYKDGFILVKYNDEFIATCFAWQDIHDDSTGQMHWLTVLPAHRRKGIAKHLALEIMRYFKGIGKSRVSLKTEPYRHDAIRMYKSLGFVPGS